jgi:hypothetical protein
MSDNKTLIYDTINNPSEGNNTPNVKWPEADVKRLQEYCLKMGIEGFNSGYLPPLVALAILKDKFGDDYTNVPLGERVPEGYEKRGTPSPYGPNYPYSEALKRKQILHG